MTALSCYRPPQEAATMGGLKKVLRKIAGPVLAAGAIAVGQPELAVAAYGVGKAATTKKPKAPALVEPPVDVAPAGGLGGFWENLTPADKEILTIGGAVVGTLLLSRVLSRR